MAALLLAFALHASFSHQFRTFSTGWLDSCNGLLNFFIGARDRAFIVHLAPKHHCSCERSTQIQGLFERRAPSECSSRPCAFQPPTKALLAGLLSQQALTRPPRPPSLEDEAQPDTRAKSQMDRAFWERSREIGAQCPGSTFAAERRGRSCTDEWSPTRARGQPDHPRDAGLFLFHTVPDMSDQCCPAYFNRFKFETRNPLKETCSLPDGDGCDVEP